MRVVSGFLRSVRCIRQLFEGPDLSRIDALIQRIASQEVRAGGSGVINQPELWIHPDNVIRLDPVRYSAAEMTGPALQRFARGMFEDLYLRT